MSNDLTLIQQEIAASLWMLPCTFEELCKRDFLKGKSEYGVQVIMGLIENKGWIYQRGDKYYCYKSTAKMLNREGYELDLKEEHLSDFEKAYIKSTKR